ncbi:hypothetical protein ACET3X_008076 [Alternaria dauci]|uniref:DUF7707 domain-containing protein n=1 Tax=Alternaria dauci TaxID=48095 RepID=A0ABR3UB39_9PLEO
MVTSGARPARRGLTVIERPPLHQAALIFSAPSTTMLFSSIIVAASAFASFASAQNSTGSYDTPIPCCSVDAGSVPADDKDTWCTANENTCVELCGGQGQLASNGNECESDTLEYSCQCRNGTDVSDQMGAYQQTVPGLMCRYWYDQCIAATGSDAAAQFQCNLARDNECGNLTTADATESGNSATASSSDSSPSATSSGAPDSTAESSASGASSTPTGAASRIAVFGTPALAGGLFALFGFALSNILGAPDQSFPSEPLSARYLNTPSPPTVRLPAENPLSASPHHKLTTSSRAEARRTLRLPSQQTS